MDRVKLQIWDTAGQERFRNITHAYYRGAHATVIVYDITKAKSFENVTRQWLPAIQQFSSEDVEIVLVGNKVDLETHREIPRSVADDLAKLQHMQFLESSAKDNTNVHDIFMHTANRVLLKLKQKLAASQSTGPTIPPFRVRIDEVPRTSRCC